jgi:hypothetical protein
MVRLPIVNSDDGTWGDIIRDFIMKEHLNDDNIATATNGGHKTITIAAGTTSANTAPIRFTSGALMTTPEVGAMEYNGTFYLTDASARRQVTTDTGTQTLTNKTIDANGTGNSITNLEVADFAGSAVVTEAEGIASNDNDTTLPTSAAVKDYVDSSGVIAWSQVTGTTQSAGVNRGYITNNAALVTVTLPATAAIGNIVQIVGKGAGGWRIAQNSGQVIHFGNMDTTSGTGGRLDSTSRYDTIQLMCITANSDWSVVTSVGNIEVV